jgi:hydroxyacid-oxoacid transhydrogenase
VRTFTSPGYPGGPLVPHGMAVAVAAPAVFRAFAGFTPERHREAAELLGGDELARCVSELARSIGIPNGIAGIGYGRADIADLVAGTLPQQRLLANAPCEIDGECLAQLFEQALSYE